jgi:hypothetical protein
MRSFSLISIPVLATLAAFPLTAQVRARVHVDIPIGRPGREVYASRRAPLVIGEYDVNRYGAYEDYYDSWAPETVYLYDGYYYDYPVDPYATAVVVYRYNNQYFFAPRTREFVQWRDYGRNYGGYGYRPYVREEYRGRPVPGGYNRGSQEYRQPRDTRNDYRQGGQRGPVNVPQQGDHRGGGMPQPSQGDHRGQGGGMQQQPQQNDHRGQGGQDTRGASAGHDPRSGSGNRGGGRPRP